ncbi:hypothetical protein LCGC14_1150580, partial [marine sediment metagenome]
GVNESGYLQLYIQTPEAEAIAEYGTSGAISLDQWNYIAVRYDDGNVDVLIGDTWYTTPAIGQQEPWSGGGNFTDGGKFIIGAELTILTCFTGKLDDITVFNTTLSDVEIEEHGSAPPALDLYAEFEENSDSFTYDVIHGYEGVLEGNTGWTPGKDGYGLSFDGETTITIPEMFGTTLYGTYSEISYEYMSGGGSYDSTGSPQTTSNIDRSIGGGGGGSTDTGWVITGTGTSETRSGSSASWINPYQIEYDENPGYASTSANDLINGEYSDWLRATNFDFASIPEGATLEGIEVRIDKRAQYPSRGYDDGVYLRDSITQVGDDKSKATAWGTTMDYYVYGGPTDTWNSGLSISDIKTTNFGVELSGKGTSPSYNVDLHVDAIQVKIYYTVPTSESYITSIQQVEITLTGTSASANLAANTVVTNCIPFMSMEISGTSGDWDEIMIDVYFTAGSPPTITVERNLADGTIYVSIFIIEFDGTNVVVQQGIFDLTAAETATNEVISSITLTKAFAKTFYKMGGTGDSGWDHTKVKTWFSDNTHINFERHMATATLNGHWYIAEAQGSEFITQAISMPITSGTKTQQVINAVTMAKTMVIGSYETEEYAQDSQWCAFRLWLEDSTHISVERDTLATTRDAWFKGWVIEFAASSDISIQRGQFSYADSDDQETVDINTVTQANSIIINPMFYGLMEESGGSFSSLEGAFQKLTFVDSDTIIGDRAAPVDHAVGNWEVIDFGSAVITGGGSTSDTEDWVNTNKATLQDDDDLYVSFSASTEDTSDWLRLTDLGFNIPIGATIDGIEVQIEKEATVSSSIKDEEIYLRKTVGQAGINRADTVNYWDIVDDDNYDIYGGPTDLFGTTWTAAEINSADFGVDLYVKYFGGVAAEARIDHVQIIVYCTESSSPQQLSGIVRPDGDITSQWNVSEQFDHYSLLNEIITEPTTPDTNNGYIFTSSQYQGTTIIDEFSMETTDISGGSVTQITIKVFGNETDFDSTVDVYCGGSWLGAKQLDMGSTPGWYTYTWSGLSLSQTDLDDMKIKFESIVPEAGSPIIEGYDYVDFGDILDDVLGNNYEFVVTGWVNPSLLGIIESNNAIKNVFLSKDGNLELGINENGYLQVYINANGVETTAEYGIPNAFPTDQWTFVAVRYTDGDVDVMIGEDWYYSAVGGIPEPWSGGGNLVNGGDFVVGAELSTFSCFTGKVDSISVFNRSLSNLEVEDHKGQGILTLSTQISKEDGLGGWTPITPSTSGEAIEGYINFECFVSGNDVDTLELYLSDTEPDLANPNPNEWILLTSPYTENLPIYSFLKDSWELPDNDSWYFIVKGTDIDNNIVYASSDGYFSTGHFADLIDYTYLDKDGRIDETSQIGVIPREGHEWHLISLNVYLNYSGVIDFLTNVNYNDLYSNYWLIYLDSISDWIISKGLTPDNYDVNFIIEANLTYAPEFGNYLFTYTLGQIILDIKAPEMTLLSGDPYSLELGKTYDDILNNTLTMAINSTDISRPDSEIYLDDLSNSNWYLDGVPLDSFTVKTSEISNYLTDSSILIPEWNYTGVSYPVTQNHRRIRYHDGYWYILYNDVVYKYDSDWIFTDISYDLVDVDTDVIDMRFNDDDGYWWVISSSAMSVYKYYENWTYTGTDYPSPSGNTFCMDYLDGYWYILTQGVGMQGIPPTVNLYYADNWTYTGITYDIPYATTRLYSANDVNYFEGYWYVSDNDEGYTYIVKFYPNWTRVGEINDFLVLDYGTNTNYFDTDGNYWYASNGFHNEIFKYSTSTSVISKFYQGNGYVYMQTNTTETVSLKSQTFTPVDLIINDYFSIELQSTAPFIDLQLLNSGSVVRTLTVLSDNINYGYQTIIVPIDEDITFDQLMFTGILDDTEYFKVYNINVTRTPTFDFTIDNTDFQRVKLEYKYMTPNTANWIYYDEFNVDNNFLAPITWNIENLRDDKIAFRFILYDNLGNSEILSSSAYWIIKDFNNHLEFTVEGLSNEYLYALDPDYIINLDLKTIPVDNDITSVVISTNYETFTLTDVLFEQDHIFFEDHDINLTSALYN